MLVLGFTQLENLFTYSLFSPLGGGKCKLFSGSLRRLLLIKEEEASEAEEVEFNMAGSRLERFGTVFTR